MSDHDEGTAVDPRLRGIVAVRDRKVTKQREQHRGENDTPPVEELSEWTRQNHKKYEVFLRAFWAPVPRSAAGRSKPRLV
jgi:hypothetical protein